MKTLYVLPLLVASGLLAASGANALTLDNGRNINGRNLNGLSFNGRNINGRNVNGVALRGAAEVTDTVKAVTVILQDGERVTLNYRKEGGPSPQDGRGSLPPWPCCSVLPSLRSLSC